MTPDITLDTSLPKFAALSPDELLLERWPSEIDHVSASNLVTAMRCPETYRRRYLAGEREPRSDAILIGSAGDKAVQENFRQKIDTKIDLPLSDVLYVAAEAFDTEVAESGIEHVLWAGNPRSKKGRKAARDKALDVAVACAEAYHVGRSQFVQPRAVEAPFEIMVPEIPVPIQGRIDAIIEPRRIVERKTVGQRGFRADWRFQMQVYQLAKPGHRAELDLVIKNKTPVVEPAYGYVKVMTPAARVAMLTLMQGILAGIAGLYDRYGPMTPWPTTALAHPWACDYCGFGPKGDRSCAWWAPFVTGKRKR